MQLRVHELVQLATRDAQAATREAQAAARERPPPESPSLARRTLESQLREAEARGGGARLREAEVRVEQLEREVAEARSQALVEARGGRSAAASAAVTAAASGRGAAVTAEVAREEAEARADALRAALAERDQERARHEAAAKASERELAEMAQRAQLLTHDKEYLAAQLAALQERCGTHEGTLLRRETRLTELKAEKEQLYHKLVAATAGAADSYSSRLDSEMSKWQQQASLAQAAIEQAHERQCAQLREARELAVAEVDKAHTRHAELQRSHDELLVRCAEQHAAAEVELTQLRSEVRIKAFEAERLSLQCEHSLAGSRRDGAECDVSREKMEVLKGAYYALQAESGQRIASLEAQLHGQQERLSTYDKMEHELDAAVASAGGGGGSGPRIVVPTSAQRRLDQCVRLSAQLLAAQTRADELSKELRASGGEVERLHERLQTAERRWQLVHSPQAYLVGQLRNAEEAAEAAVAQQRSAARTLRENDATLTDVREQHRLLQARHLDITPLARAAPAQSSQHACGTCDMWLQARTHTIAGRPGAAAAEARLLRRTARHPLAPHRQGATGP